MADRHPSIVSVCVSGFAGTNEAQRSIARISRRVRHFVMTDPRINGPETRFLLAHFRQLRPKTIILGGWSEHYRPLLRLARHGTAFAVYWTSSGGQTEISGEMDRFATILGEPRIGRVLFADVALAASRLTRLKPASFLPVPVGESPSIAPGRRPGRAKVLSLFCSPHEYARKNGFNVLLAIAALRHRCVLYLNGLSQRADYALLLRRLGIEHRDFGWMDRDTYLRTLDGVDLGLQVSVFESFGQVVADHLIRGIPVVTALTMPALRGMPRLRNSPLVVTNADDWRDIHAAIERALAHVDASRRSAAGMRRHVLVEDRRRRKHIHAVLRRLS